MTDDRAKRALKRIEEMYECESCYWGQHAKKLARALDYYREHHDDGRVAHAVLEEVAGE
jgi:hypothetical protein